MDAMQRRHDFGQQGFIGGAVAEIRADGVDQGLLFTAQQLKQGLQPLPALFQGRQRVAGKGAALALEGGLQLVNLLLAVMQVGDVGNHGCLRGQAVGCGKL